MTSAAAGCLTEEPTSTMRSFSTRTSPGEIIFPDAMSRRRAAWSTVGYFEDGVDWPKTDERKTQVRKTIEGAMERVDLHFIMPGMIPLRRLSWARVPPRLHRQ